MQGTIRTKIIKVGNSKGFIVPAQGVQELALELGDEVHLQYHYDKQLLQASFPKTKQLKLRIK